MSRVQQIAEQVRTFTAYELRELRDVLVEYEQKLWDEQIDTDSNAGKLDWLLDKALEDERQGRTTPL